MKKIVVIFLSLISSASLAQKIKLLHGSLQGLDQEKSFNIVFRYDSMLIGVTTPEKDYLAEKKRLWEVKEPGKGSDFVEKWFDDRKALYKPAFIENFEKYAKVKLVDRGANYTLIVKTKRTEGGWNVGLVSQMAEIDGELWVVKSANEGEVVAKVEFKKSKGKSYGGDFEMTTRIQAAYASAGKGLGDFIKKKYWD